jgi:Transposase.
MDTIGLDLHKRESQLSIIGSQGEITEKRIVTTRERFTAVLGGRPRCRILLEASTESEWVARHLESLGHDVIVADPGFAPMYATRSKKVKTDKRDARTLAEACVLGANRGTQQLTVPPAHVTDSPSPTFDRPRPRDGFTVRWQALLQHTYHFRGRII